MSRRVTGCSLSLLLAALAAIAPPAKAAKEDGCTGGAFSIVTANGVIVGNQTTTLPKASLGATFSVQGRFVKFDVVSANFGVLHYTFVSSSANPTPIVAFASKTPDLQGLTLTGDVSVSISDESLTIRRAGTGISMQIQANDCSTGGIFQMEPERGDGTATDIVHTLGADVFYFNNPNFGPPPPPLPLCPAGGPFTPACTPVPITPRVNFATDFSRSFVGRDSPQSATKIAQTGGTSTWRVRKRRAHGRGVRRGCGGSGAASCAVHVALPGAGSGSG